jgi:hypothetical protein
VVSSRTLGRLLDAHYITHIHAGAAVTTANRPKLRRGLRKRPMPEYTRVPNETVNDARMSLRALGLLTWILEKPDGWDVRSAQIAGGSADREGTQAVQTTLHELAKLGYYRLIRATVEGGRHVMVTDVSARPVHAWAQQNRIFTGTVGIPVVIDDQDQWCIRYPDGTLLPEDQPPPADMAPAPKQIRRRPPGAPPPPRPSSGKRIPVTGKPATGNSSPLQVELLTKEDEQSPGPAARDRPPPGEHRPAKAPRPPRPEPEPTPREPTPHDLAFGIGRDWMTHRATAGVPVAGRQVLHRLKSLVEPFLEGGYTVEEIKRAIAAIGVGVPTAGQLDRALGEVRQGRRTRTRPPVRVEDVNAYWANDQQKTGTVGQNAETENHGLKASATASNSSRW